MKTIITRREFGRRGGVLAAGLAAGVLPADSSVRSTGAAESASKKTAKGRPPLATSKTRTLRVRMLDAAGKPMPKRRLETLYVADLHFEPERQRRNIQSDGTVEIEATIKRATLRARIPVPGFGDVWVTADNDGEGYDSPKATLDFVAEAASSHLTRAHNLMNSSDAPFSVECSCHHDAAIVFLKFAKDASGEEAADYRMTALAHALWAGELAVVEHARHGIARGKPRRDFLFGCNTFRYAGDTRYAEYFARVMNYGTLPFYLRSLEREEGKPNYEKVDRILNWCETAGIRPKGHPLWWGHEAGIPKWLDGASWPEARRHCERVVGRSVARYRGRIDYWDVINEAHDWANGLKLTQEQQIEITRVCCETARSKNPKATIVVNNCCPFGEYAAQGRVHLGPVYDRILTPLNYLDWLLNAGVEFDVVGVQIYFPGTDMMTINRLLDEYARFDKPVHITELGVRSAGGAREGDGEWHQPWSEKVQADWMEWFYTIAYARPEIEAITWWDFADPAFIKTSGFLRRDYTPREIFFRLQALKRAWGVGA